jgi:hypothetical protein
MVWARTFHADDNVVYQVRRFFFWKFWATVKDSQYNVEWELHEWALEGKRLLERRREVVDQVQAELKDAKSQPRDRNHIGKPFRTTWKTLKSMVRCEQSKPPEDWKDMLNPGIKIKYDVNGSKGGAKKASDGQATFTNSSNPQPGKTAYTLEDLSGKNIDFQGADTAMVFKEPKKENQSGDQNNRKALRKQIVNENPIDDGEDQGSYNKRIDSILKRRLDNSND